MGPTRINLYNPFQKSSLFFLLTNDSNLSTSSHYEAVSDIDLYHQPLEKPSVVLAFFIIKSIIICAGEGICIRLLSSLKKEKGLLTDVIKLFVIIQMISYPAFHCIEIVINTAFPVSQLIGDWICFLAWLLWGVSGRILLSNSLICALMRYLFIVHEQKVDSYGKEKVKRWFLYLSITLPLIQFTLHAMAGSPRLSFVNKCYGNDHRVFLFKTSTLIASKPFAHMVPGRTVVTEISKVVDLTWFLLMGFNVTEALLYFKIFNKLNR